MKWRFLRRLYQKGITKNRRSDIVGKEIEVCRLSILEIFLSIFDVQRLPYHFLWHAATFYERRASMDGIRQNSLRSDTGSVPSLAQRSLRNACYRHCKMICRPLRWYIEQKFPYAIRLLDNGRWISSENMERRMISTTLYSHIKWKYVANRFMIFSRKDGAQFAAMIARLPLWSLR